MTQELSEQARPEYANSPLKNEKRLKGEAVPSGSAPLFCDLNAATFHARSGRPTGR
jgi:hypothetical protein